MHRRLIARFVVRETMGVVLMGVALFWSAGRADWWAGWALLAVTAGWIAATTIVIVRRDPGLLAERLGPRRGAPRWDIAILSAYGLLQLAVLVVAGLGEREGGGGGPAPAVQVLALATCILGYALIVWATAVNAFFSQVVRIQSERGHTVVTTGPYRHVRHPGNGGSLLTALAVPVLLGSWQALALGAAAALLMVLRTALEDRTLRAKLPGYAAYARRVRRRLLPGVW